MSRTIGYAAHNSFSDLKPMEIERREPQTNDVEIDILFCGVCHSDVHQVKNEWKNSIYPCMPGHEIVGRVTRLGPSAKMHKVGDIVGVGCMVDSCHNCAPCHNGLENYCDNGFLGTYNGNSRTPKEENNTFGGYSKLIVVREDFVLKIPEGMDHAAAAPIMCAGVTTYSPLKYWNVGKGSKIGIVGLGGLGQMAVKLALAMGAEVTVITTSEHKQSDATKMGAAVLLSTDNQKMKAHEKKFDFILSTIPEEHDINPYIPLLTLNGVITIVGCLMPLSKGVDMGKMIMDRRSISSSVIGSIAETQEVLDFCAEHNIVSNIQIINIDAINEIYKEIDKGNPDYRYVIDIASLNDKKEDQTLLSKIGF